MQSAEDHDFSVSNEELLELVKRQDQEALRVLFRRHERPVYALLYRMLSSREDAEEALAEVFVKVWRAAATFKGDARFTTWLFRITANTARDFLRSRRGRQEVSIEDVPARQVESHGRAQPGSSPEKSLLDSEDIDRIVTAMQELPEEDRLLVSLYHFQGREYDEITQITDIPASNLKVRLFRARQRLRKICAELEKGGGENELRTDTTESAGLQQGAADWV